MARSPQSIEHIDNDIDTTKESKSKRRPSERTNSITTFCGHLPHHHHKRMASTVSKVVVVLGNSVLIE